MKHTLTPAMAAIVCLLGAPAQALTCANNNLPSNPTAVYDVDGASGTVTDPRTGLVWTLCLEGQSGAGCTGGAATAMTWAQALEAAAQASVGGHGDWRLPNVKELRSLLEYCRTAPAINGDVFQNQPDGDVWTGTPAGDADAWAVDFTDGLQSQAGRATQAHVRLVRGGLYGADLALLPQLSGVTLGAVAHDQATVQAASSQNGKIHALVLARGAAAPTPAQVRDGAVVSAAAVARAPVSVQITTGLAAGTAYDIYLVAESQQGGYLGGAVTKVEFTTSVPGLCGSAAGGTALWPSAPATAVALCQSGTATPATGGTTHWSWSCQGSAGQAAQCQAPRGYTVTPSAGAGGSIDPATAQTVAYGATPRFTVAPAGGYNIGGVGGTCGGSLAGAEYTVNAVTGDCTVAAMFTAVPTYAIATSASPAEGGSVACTPNPVTHGGTAACTATPAPGYRFTGWTGGCSGSGACQLDNVTSARSVGAQFVRGAGGLALAEGPYQGQPLVLDVLPGQGDWRFAAAATLKAADLDAPLPPGVSLPHGVVSVALHQGTPGSSAQVVLTYPEALPPGTVYYKYGPTEADRQPHWYPFGGARIAGNTITLTLTDGKDGDDDLARNGHITDPGGPALLAAPSGAQAIPTLGEWGLLLLSALAGLLGWRQMRAKSARNA